MYHPIQLPYLLNREFSANIKYTERSTVQCRDFVVCFWEMSSVSSHKMSIENIILVDACIDLVVSYDEKKIGFSGMSRTAFHFRLDLPGRYFGARLRPGAFHQLTGIPASFAMDTFLPLSSIYEDFNQEQFFMLSFEQAQKHLESFLVAIAFDKMPNTFSTLFDSLFQNTPATSKELYQKLFFSPRQCQRLFKKHFGISPKLALSIVRFQKCVEILLNPNARAASIHSIVGYYDQPHFIKDFKRNMGITPLELIRVYQE